MFVEKGWTNDWQRCFQNIGNILDPDLYPITRGVHLIKIYQALHFWCVHSSICILHFNKRFYLKFTPENLELDLFGNFLLSHNFKFIEKLQESYKALLYTLSPDPPGADICLTCFIILSVCVRVHIFFLDCLKWSCKYQTHLPLNTSMCISYEQGHSLT